MKSWWKQDVRLLEKDVWKVCGSNLYNCWSKDVWKVRSGRLIDCWSEDVWKFVKKKTNKIFFFCFHILFYLNWSRFLSSYSSSSPDSYTSLNIDIENQNMDDIQESIIIYKNISGILIRSSIEHTSDFINIHIA